MSRFSIVALQLELHNTNNLDLLQHELLSAKRRYPWADMMILPELSAFGVDQSYAEEPGGATEQRFIQWAKELGVWLIPGSIYQRDNGAIYNTAPIIDPMGELKARCRKLFPFLPYEQCVANGREFCVFDLPGVGRIGVCICYDNWFPEVLRSLVCLGAEMIICPTLTGTIDRGVELAIAQANAAMHQVYFLSLNVAGRLGNGRSILVGPDGKVLHQSGTTHELIAAEIDFAHVRNVRERGLDGLGQVLKSFRDADQVFPVYQHSSKTIPALRALGPLQMPARLLGADESGASGDSDLALRRPRRDA